MSEKLTRAGTSTRSPASSPTTRRLLLMAFGSLSLAIALMLGLATSASAGHKTGRPPGVPAAGKSKIIDKILQSGVISVAVTDNYPGLFQVNGQWQGPAWLLTQDIAQALGGVKIKIVTASNATKVPLLVNGGVDMTVTPLSATPDRRKVIDFAFFGNNAECAIGLKTNSKLAAVKSIRQLNSPNFTIAAYAGTSQQSEATQDFPKAHLRIVIGNGSQPVAEILSRRSDVVVASYANVPHIEYQYKDVISIPRDCEHSTYRLSPWYIGLPKSDLVFTKFAQGVAAQNKAKLEASLATWIKYGFTHPKFVG